MTFRSIALAAALALPACAATTSTSPIAAPSGHVVPQLDFTAQHLTFPALRGDALLPSADNVAMHMEKVLGDSAATELMICVDPTGKVAKADLVKSSGLASYDAAVLEDVKAWAFEAPTSAACTDLTVVYTLR
ncbi:MAG TPA: energy transducer TonB [Kofleriaceae bacterium]|jgi:TonB family protein|nr:energy transducer TonB [Kofleriaceae bacterium]